MPYIVIISKCVALLQYTYHLRDFYHNCVWKRGEQAKSEIFRSCFIHLLFIHCPFWMWRDSTRHAGISWIYVLVIFFALFSGPFITVIKILKATFRPILICFVTKHHFLSIWPMTTHSIQGPNCPDWFGHRPSDVLYVPFPCTPVRHTAAMTHGNCEGKDSQIWSQPCWEALYGTQRQ